MSLADVDREEGDAAAEALREVVERADLRAKGRSGVGAEDEGNGLSRGEAAEPHRRAAVEARELEVQRRIAELESGRPQVAVIVTLEDVLETEGRILGRPPLPVAEL
jgi:hypothetical protein